MRGVAKNGPARLRELLEKPGIIRSLGAHKRCGHFEGKQVIEPHEMVLKLRVALKARENPEFVIIARTDAREVLGLQAAIERANRYGEVGADVVFIEAPL